MSSDNRPDSGEGSDELLQLVLDHGFDPMGGVRLVDWLAERLSGDLRSGRGEHRLARVDVRYLRHLMRCEDYAVEEGFTTRTAWEDDGEDVGGDVVND